MVTFNRTFAALLVATTLTGCGGLDLIVLPLAIGAGIHQTTVAVNKSLVDAMFRGVECAIATGFSSMGPKVRIELDAEDFQLILDQVRARVPKPGEDFWTGLDLKVTAKLRRDLRASYAEVSTDPVIGRHPVEYYEDILIAGLVNASRDRVAVRRLTLGRHVRVQENPVRYESFLVVVNVRHTETTETKSYVTCE